MQTGTVGPGDAGDTRLAATAQDVTGIISHEAERSVRLAILVEHQIVLQVTFEANGLGS
jgi:hypothetical protein